MSGRPRILWLTQGSSPKLPSQRLRVLEIIPLLADDFEIDYCPAPTKLITAWQLRHRLRQADVVILQKELVSSVVVRLLRFFSRRLVYDFDDAVYVRLLPGGNCRPSGKRASRFATICRTADLLIAGNPILEQVAVRYGAKQTGVLPTAVVAPIVLPVFSGEQTAVSLGWIGTDVNLPYLESLEAVFLALEEEGLAFTLRIMAGRPPVFRSFKAFEFVPWAVDAEESFLVSLDVGLMPLEDNEHSRGKCAYKALQYMAYGKPVVVSDVGVNAAWTIEAGFAVRSEVDMVAALRKLIVDSKLREGMGLAGRRRVLAEFTRPVVADKLRQLLSAVIRPASREQQHV